MKRLSFSTDAAPPEVRREIVAAAFAAHVEGEIDFPAEAPPCASMQLAEFGDVRLALIESSPVVLHTPQATSDAIYLGIALSGGGVIDAGGEARPVAAGDVNLMGRERRCVTVVDRPSRILSVMAPRGAIADRLGFAPERAAPAAPATRLLQTYASAILREGNAFSVAEEMTLAGHIADLVAMELGGVDETRAAAPGTGVRAARRQAIKDTILASLADPDLSLDWLSRRHRLSGSYIRALFYDEGDSVSDYISVARLDRAAHLLRSPTCADKTIAAIALAAGFGDVSWFNKVFRRRYAMTPSEWRAQRPATTATR